MNITCDKCSYVINVPEEEVRKIPPGKQASIKCPKCDRKFSVSFGKSEANASKDIGRETFAKAEDQRSESKASESLFGFVEDESAAEVSSSKVNTKKDTGKKETLDDVISSDIYDASDKPFDFVEEEGKTALVCEKDPKLKGPIVENLNLMEYHITEVDNSRSALKKMRYHVYDVIVVNENFDTNSPDANVVLIYLERLSMSVRRNIFVAMLSNRYRTMDNMVALQKSVDIIINNKNIADVGKILSRGVTDKDFFYRAFKDTLLGANI